MKPGSSDWPKVALWGAALAGLIFVYRKFRKQS